MAQPLKYDLYWRGSGAIRASGMRLASFSLRSSAGSQKRSIQDLKEAKALLGFSKSAPAVEVEACEYCGQN